MSSWGSSASTSQMSNLSPIKLISDLTRHGHMASPGYSENVDFKSIRWRHLNGLFLKSTQSSGATPIGCTFDAPNRTTIPWSQNVDFKSIRWRPLNGLFLKSTQRSGATPNRTTVPWSQNVDFKSIRWRPLNGLFLKSTQSSGATSIGQNYSTLKPKCWFQKHKMKTFEWIISKIHSKLGGYNQWVHLRCTQQQNRN
jgi:hypothetical protein